jgi:hypothetical protein
MAAPNVILCSMQNAGASAIDPILRDLLLAKGYFWPPFGPEATTDRLRKELAEGQIRQPFYHWTHDPIETFRGLVGSEAYRFIFLHRDPRDIAVSIAFDYQKRGFAADRSFNEILEMLVLTLLPAQIKEAIEWVRSGCMIITFDRMKKDTAALMKSVLTYINYPEIDETLSGAPLSADQISAVIQKYSFESVTGRQRGEDGEMVRTNYMFRKGVSGEWKKYFSEDLTRKYKKLFGLELRALGYFPEGDAP